MEEAKERLELLSRQDSLTGIPNRRHFDEMLEVEWRRAYRAGSTLCLILLDIDCFKRYNDAYGHLRGDECLKQVANVLREATTHAGDVAARYGGEEFVVLLPATDIDGAEGVAERLRAAVEGLGIPHKYSVTAPVVTISVGVGLAEGDRDESPAALIAAADEALYLAKHEGRNLVRSATLQRAIRVG